MSKAMAMSRILLQLWVYGHCFFHRCSLLLIAVACCSQLQLLAHTCRSQLTAVTVAHRSSSNCSFTSSLQVRALAVAVSLGVSLANVLSVAVALGVSLAKVLALTIAHSSNCSTTCNCSSKYRMQLKKLWLFQVVIVVALNCSRCHTNFWTKT